MPSKLEIKYKTGKYFSYSFGRYFIQLDIIHELQGLGGRAVLYRKNLLSMKKLFKNINSEYINFSELSHISFAEKLFCEKRRNFTLFSAFLSCILLY